MGAVYEGHRTDGTHQRRVAVKVLDRLHHPALVARFQTEQQILASLRHPNIARLYDSGISEQGYPYFVMEFVDGLPIDKYVNANLLDVRERLQLFQKICAAVHFAHQNLIIHRDLKPANILVTGEGEPILLDFGIAKLLDPGTEATETGMRAMTRAYASPEQIMNQPLTIGSDVYSLGVILYEILSGSSPYQPRTDSPFDLEKAIVEETPVGLSKQALLNGSNIKIKGAIYSPGDLDGILMMALAKDTNHRYASVEQFNSDVGNLLSGFPVIANTTSRWNSVFLFVKRNRVTISIGSFSLLSVLLFLIFALFQRGVALEETQNTREVTNLLVALFKTADPYQSPKEQIHVDELISKGVNELDKVEHNDKVRATLSLALAKLCLNTSRYEKARSLIEQSLNLHRSLGLDDNQQFADSLFTAGEVYLKLMQTTVSLESFTKSKEIYDRVGNEHMTALCDLNIGIISSIYPDKSEALKRITTSIDAFERLNKREDQAKAKVNLGTIYYKTERFGEAISVIEESLFELIQIHGEDHVLLGQNYYLLSVLNYKLEKYEIALDYGLKGYRLLTRYLRSNHDQVRGIIILVTEIMKNSGNECQLEEFLLEECNENPVLFYKHLSFLYREQCRFQDALHMLNRAELYSRELPDDAFSPGDILVHKGLLFWDMGDLKEAERWLFEAICHYEEKESTALLFDLLLAISEMYLDYEKIPESGQILNFARTLFEKSSPDDYGLEMFLLSFEIEHLSTKGDLEAASNKVKKLHKYNKSYNEKKSHHFANVYQAIANYQKVLGNYEIALKNQLKAMPFLLRYYPEFGPEVAKGRLKLAEIYQLLGNNNETCRHFKLALHNSRAGLRPSQINLVTPLSNHCTEMRR